MRWIHIVWMKLPSTNPTQSQIQQDSLGVQEGKIVLDKPTRVCLPWVSDPWTPHIVFHEKRKEKKRKRAKKQRKVKEKHTHTMTYTHREQTSNTTHGGKQNNVPAERKLMWQRRGEKHQNQEEKRRGKVNRLQSIVEKVSAPSKQICERKANN